MFSYWIVSKQFNKVSGAGGIRTHDKCWYAKPVQLTAVPQPRKIFCLSVKIVTNSSFLQEELLCLFSRSGLTPLCCVRNSQKIFFSARTRTQTTRTRILGATYLHHREVISGRTDLNRRPSRPRRAVRTSWTTTRNMKAAGGARTRGLLLGKQALYQLRYCNIIFYWASLIWTETSALSERVANQLLLMPKVI